jgi:CBS domain-containing protein
MKKRVRVVREIMSSAHLVTCDAGTTLQDAAQVMKQNDVGSIVILDGGRIIGIFTERDAVNRVVALGCDPATTAISEVMTPDPDVVRPNDPVSEAIRKMDEFRYRHLPVVEDGRLLGVLSVRDLSLRDLASMAYELDTRHNFTEHGW